MTSPSSDGDTSSPTEAHDEESRRAGRTAGAQRAVATVGWSSVGTVAMFASSAVGLVVLSRILDPADFGVMAAANTIGLILRGIGPTAISQTIIAKDAAPDAIRSATTYMWALCLSLAFGLIVVASPLASLLGVSDAAWVFRAWSLVIVAQGVSSIPMAVLQHDLAFKKLSMVQVVASVLGNGAVPIVLAVAGFGVSALYGGVLTVAVVEAVCLTLVVRQAFLPDLRAPIRGIARTSWVFSATIATATVANNGDNLVVGATLGDTALGLYSRAYRLMSLPAILVGDAIDTALFPVIRRARADVELIAKGAEVSSILLAIVLFPIVGASIAMAETLVTTVLGSQWLDAVPIFQVLACGMFFRVGTKPFAAVLRGSGNHRRLAGVTTANAATVLAASVIGSVWGTTGVATGVVLALGVYYFNMASAAMRSIERPLRPLLGKLGGLVPVGACAAVVAWQVDSRAGSLPGLFTLALGFAAAGALAAGSLALPPYRRAATIVISLRSKGIAP